MLKNTRCRFQLYSIILFLAAAFVPIQGIFGEPPAATLNQIERALALLDAADTPTSYMMTTNFSLADREGTILQAIEIRERVNLQPGQKPSRETVYRHTKGEDPDATTSASQSGDASGGSGGNAWTMLFPVGENKKLFAFAATAIAGARATAEYLPIATAKNEKGITRGTVVWDVVTGFPLRIQAAPLKNLPFMSNFDFSFEFTNVQGKTFPAKIEFSGEGGFLFFIRKIASVSVISDFSSN